MKLSKNDWWFIWVYVAIFAVVFSAGSGYGAILWLPLTLLACWLMHKAFEKENPSD
jgi:hypothetical protein